MGTKGIMLMATVAAIVSVAPSCTKKKSSVAEEILTVDVATPIVDSVVLHKTYPGYLSSTQSVDIVARVNGYLQSIQYTGGSHVPAGTVLFTIESQSYADAVKHAKAALETAKATNVYAQQHYEAVKKALESDAVSKMEVIQAKSSYDESVAQIANAEAALRSATTTLGYCTVRAPFDGDISDPTVDIGAYLAGAGSPVKLATIYDNSSLKAVFSIEDSRYAEILTDRHNGYGVDFRHMPVHFADSLSRQYTADLAYTAPDVDKSTGTLTLKAVIQNPDHELKSGMYLTIDLPYATDPEAILVRDASIASDQQGKYMYTVSDSSTVVYTPVETGELVADTLRIVKSGLRPSDRYVTSALLKVRPGMKVKPVEH